MPQTVADHISEWLSDNGYTDENDLVVANIRRSLLEPSPPLPEPFFESKDVTTHRTTKPRQLYIDITAHNKRTVPPESLRTIRQGVDTERRSYMNDVRSLLNDRKAGEITSVEFNRGASARMNDAFSVARRGGFDSSGYMPDSLAARLQIEARSAKAIDRAVKEEMAYLRRFRDDYVDDKLVMPFERRLQMYADTVVHQFDYGAMESMPSNVVIWWRMSAAEHCRDCIRLAGGNPYSKPGSGGDNPLPAIPRSGHTVCLSNCKCYLQYTFDDVDVTPGPRDEFYFKTIDGEPVTPEMLRSKKWKGTFDSLNQSHRQMTTLVQGMEATDDPILRKRLASERRRINASVVERMKDLKIKATSGVRQNEILDPVRLSRGEGYSLMPPQRVLREHGSAMLVRGLNVYRAVPDSSIADTWDYPDPIIFDTIDGQTIAYQMVRDPTARMINNEMIVLGKSPDVAETMGRAGAMIVEGHPNQPRDKKGQWSRRGGKGVSQDGVAQVWSDRTTLLFGGKPTMHQQNLITKSFKGMEGAFGQQNIRSAVRHINVVPEKEWKAYREKHGHGSCGAFYINGAHSISISTRSLKGKVGHNLLSHEIAHGLQDHFHETGNHSVMRSWVGLWTQKSDAFRVKFKQLLGHYGGVREFATNHAIQDIGVVSKYSLTNPGEFMADHVASIVTGVRRSGSMKSPMTYRKGSSPEAERLVEGMSRRIRETKTTDVIYKLRDHGDPLWDVSVKEFWRLRNKLDTSVKTETAQRVKQLIAEIESDERRIK